MPAFSFFAFFLLACFFVYVSQVIHMFYGVRIFVAEKAALVGSEVRLDDGVRVMVVSKSVGCGELVGYDVDDVVFYVVGDIFEFSPVAKDGLVVFC